MSDHQIAQLPKAELVRKPLFRRMCPVPSEGVSYWLKLPITFLLIGGALPLILAASGAGNLRPRAQETRASCLLQAGKISHVTGWGVEAGRLRLWLDRPYDFRSEPWEILMTDEWPVTVVEDDRVRWPWYVELKTFFDDDVCRKAAVIHTSRTKLE